MDERLLGLVKCYEVDKKSGTLVVVIPKLAREELNIVRGVRFKVKADDEDRLIYERLDSQGGKVE